MRSKLRLRGFEDYFGEELEFIKLVQRYFDALSTIYGFEQLILCSVESSSLFPFVNSKLADISQQVFYVQEQNEILVPELTSPSVRAYYDHFNHQQTKKISYFQKCFRHEKPQHGRRRQFFQLGFEIINVKTNQSESLFDILCVVIRFLNLLIPLSQLEIHLNYIPDTIKEDLQEFACKLKIERLCKTCQERYKKNAILGIAECITCGKDFTKLGNEIYTNEYTDFLKNTFPELNCITNPRIIRGIDYYFGIVFEVYLKNKKTAIAAGGEYRDILSDKLKGINSCGVAIGIDRLYEFLGYKTDNKTITNTNILYYNDQYTREKLLDRLSTRNLVNDNFKLLHIKEAFKNSLHNNVKRYIVKLVGNKLLCIDLSTNVELSLTEVINR